MSHSADENIWLFAPENLSEAHLKSNGLIYLAKEPSRHCIGAVVLLLHIAFSQIYSENPAGAGWRPEQKDRRKIVKEGA